MTPDPGPLYNLPGLGIDAPSPGLLSHHQLDRLDRALPRARDELLPEPQRAFPIKPADGLSIGRVRESKISDLPLLVRRGEEADGQFPVRGRDTHSPTGGSVAYGHTIVRPGLGRGQQGGIPPVVLPRGRDHGRVQLGDGVDRQFRRRGAAVVQGGAKLADDGDDRIHFSPFEGSVP